MEQRLAPLFMMSHQQGRRFKRATTVGSYTVQVVNATSVAPRYVLKKGLCMCPASICVKKIIIIVHRLRFPVFFFMNIKAASAKRMGFFVCSQPCLCASRLEFIIS